jgi:hypothetical protein
MWKQSDVERASVNFSRQIAAGLVSLTMIALFARDAGSWRYRSTLTRLNLPGTGALRLETETTMEYRRLVATLNENADTFVFAHHGRNSFYFWTGKKPLTGYNPTFWRILLNREQQERIVHVLKQQLVHPIVIREESPAPLPRGILIDYLDQKKNGRHQLAI